MKKALKRMAAAALVTLSVLRGGTPLRQNAVDGRVVDANGAPLVGVTVLIKGTQSGTATGANGSYSIKAREDQTLVFSYLGYTTVEEYVGKRTAINVKMTEEASQIGAVEIVNIGYGTTTRRDLTGSVAKADLGTMMKANVTNFDQALGGRIAGVVVTTATARWAPKPISPSAETTRSRRATPRSTSSTDSRPKGRSPRRSTPPTSSRSTC